MKRYSRVYAKIDLDAIMENFNQMRKNLKGSIRMIAVIKADAYGHGAVPIAAMLEPYDYIWGYAVATVEEAVSLRHHGIKKPILLLGYAFQEHYETIVSYDIRPCVIQEKMAAQLDEAAQKQGKTLSIHLAVDTGMGRIGFADEQPGVEEICRIAGFSHLQIEGIFTHFAKADEKNMEPAKLQLQRFSDFIEKLQEKGLSIPIRHCSNSAGIIRFPEAHMDAVRAGISIYGMYPSPDVETDFVRLQPAMSLISHIVFIKEVAAGTAISYGGTFITQRRTRVATIPVGYADGYPRTLSNKGSVLIGGRRCPILGRVCMDQFMVDVTDVPEAKELDEVVLLGTSGGETISAEELGDLSGRFNYELVCDISKRVPRVFVQHHEVVGQKDYFD